MEDNNTTDIAKLLARGADPNTPDEQGNTLLMVAVRNKNAELVDLLINAGAKLNLRNKYGETAIMLASYNGLGNIVEKLYVKGAEINHKGWNPLLYAATDGHAKIIQLLLEGGVRSIRSPTTDNRINDGGPRQSSGRRQSAAEKWRRPQHQE